MATATASTQRAWTTTTAQLGWSSKDWAAHFEEDTYASSVIHAADSAALLLLADLARLMKAHGCRLADYIEEQQYSAGAGLQVLPAAHAGQALCWLGY